MIYTPNLKTELSELTLIMTHTMIRPPAESMLITVINKITSTFMTQLKLAPAEFILITPLNN